MATRFEIVLHGERTAALRAAAEEAFEEIERLEAQLSQFRSGSEIANLNARAAREPVRVTPPLFALLQHCRKLHDETDGAFDITVAPLLRCWGFRDGSGHLPDPKALADARSKVGMPLVELNPDDYTVRFAREGVMLDLGAIGKGYAIERAVEILREAGVTSALLHGGTSTVQAIGHPPDAENWKVAVENPLPAPLPERGLQSAATSESNLSQREKPQGNLLLPTSLRTEVRSPGEGYDESEPQKTQSPSSATKDLLATVELKDEAMSVSGIRGKFFEADGKTFGHILDPRTGQPAMNAAVAVVVLPSATETDALSTALLTLGPDGHNKIFNLRPGMRTLVATESNGALSVESRNLPV
jgi:thiamine biosynthesis lipoprotein